MSKNIYKNTCDIINELKDLDLGKKWVHFNTISFLYIKKHLVIVQGTGTGRLNDKAAPIALEHPLMDWAGLGLVFCVFTWQPQKPAQHRAFSSATWAFMTVDPALDFCLLPFP